MLEKHIKMFGKQIKKGDNFSITNLFNLFYLRNCTYWKTFLGDKLSDKASPKLMFWQNK